MPRTLLTDITIRNLPTPEKGQLDFWDVSLRTFGVRCSYGGTKTFVLKQNGTRQVIGQVGIITLKQAREEARRRIALKYLPQLNTIRINDAKEQYLHAKRSVLRTSTFIRQRNLLKGLPDKNIQQLTIADLEAILKPLPPPTARNTLQAIKTFISWCVQRQHLQVNPLQTYKLPYKRTNRTRVLSEDELKLLWRATAKLSDFDRLVRCMILTGQRVGQFNHFKHSWIKGDVIEFPAEYMKSGHSVSLPICRLPPYLPTSSTPFTNFSQATNKLRASLNFPHFVLHDLRRTFSTKMAEWNICTLDITEAILDHTTGSRSHIQRVYDRYDRLAPMREALNAYQRRMLQLVAVCKS